MDLLTDKARDIILMTLKLKSQKDIIDLEYPPMDLDHDIDREGAINFSRRTRGSIRLGGGRFYTFQEYENRRKSIKEQKLP